MTISTHDPVLREAAADWRAGNRTAARHRLDAVLARHPEDAALLAFAGLLACQDDDPGSGIALLRRSLARNPGDQASRFNLLMALVSIGAIDEAAQDGRLADPADPRVARVLGYVAQQQGRHADAVDAYARVVAAMPGDAQSWNNLGNAQAATGDLDTALEAFDRAARLRPGDATPILNASRALAAVHRHAERVTWTRRGAALLPGDHAMLVELGLAEASERHFPEAEFAFRRAIAVRPDHAEPYIELGLLLENLNRIDALAALVAAALGAGVAADEIAIVAAWSARRQGRWDEATALARRIDAAVIPLRRHHLLADLADRTGDTATAFAEFAAMNAAAERMVPPREGPTYRDRVETATAELARGGRAAVGPVATATDPASPVFIVGFPRSGTTLLDTLLMNDARFYVTEELAMLPQVEAEAREAGGVLQADADALRHRYFALLDELAPAPADTTVIDKFPLHLARLPLIHRLFPDARVVLVERHPCDVVLSCFMANFQLNDAMRHFTTLAGAAALYDAAFRSFGQAIATLPIAVHRVRYERLVVDLEAEMRGLMDFIGKSWNPAVLDNQASASRRAHIRTASYSQVTEPIYSRAAGRWQRYRPFMAEVLPVLAPWCERLGYDLGEPGGASLT